MKDKKEFEFDPARTVLEICRIYINLEKCEGFCLAVCQDGRSYSANLFEYAQQVLGESRNSAIVWIFAIEVPNFDFPFIVFV